ncbi:MULTISPECIES: uroporphyrinogen-III C-methyltransferase [unclassified Vibrio]|uniref:uroporphyrinogen-III C-methyltransferase n=1 Tax=Vibrio sp. HB236076 TaxID=3232307 RepID=A0AB39HF62_9VIBR|nr:uroporphyrinogen-III C-methyltransferase [Vibrio sp. HB161653]MDP5254642.1 uroporphyrinogen-III C-methyltransferase [Vibrio sp. HB161653]
MSSNQSYQAQVSLVGAGPGDPELLTLKALKAIQSAEVIVYDNLVSQEIRDLFPHKASQVYVGKMKGCHRFKQDDINLLLVNFAEQGKRVCRVKGGDAFVFGRGSEEMLYLAKAGVNLEVIPGITAASGCSTYANIPLTHRGLSQGCTFITAHADKELNIQWQALADLKQTLVIYMGLTKTDQIQNSLMAAKMSPYTPVALIEKGCTPSQRTLIGQLKDLSELVAEHQVQSPALIVIGEVVNVSSQMSQLTDQIQRQNAQQEQYTAPLAQVV